MYIPLTKIGSRFLSGSMIVKYWLKNIHTCLGTQTKLSNLNQLIHKKKKNWRQLMAFRETELAKTCSLFYMFVGLFKESRRLMYAGSNLNIHRFETIKIFRRLYNIYPNMIHRFIFWYHRMFLVVSASFKHIDKFIGYQVILNSLGSWSSICLEHTIFN